MLGSLPALSSQALPSLLSFAATAKPSLRRRLKPLAFPAGAGVQERRSPLGFRRGASRFVRRCGEWDREGDFALEAEILEFMTNSDKPEAFPSKRELVNGGRRDLVDAILEKGGWMALGWNLEEEEEHERVIGFSSYGVFEEFSDSSSGDEEEIQSSAMVSSYPYDEDYSQPASSSGRSLEMGTTDNESGIEGILSRLEKERNFTFGFNASENEDRSFSASDDGNEDWHSKFSTDASGPVGSGKSSSLSSKKVLFDKSGSGINRNKTVSDVDGLSNSPKPDTWRYWSIQRAGISDINSEDTEIVASETGIRGTTDISKGDKRGPESASEQPGGRNRLGRNKHGEINHNQLRSRLQHLELELSSVLRAVKSKADDVLMEKDKEISSDDLEKLSDAWEFQQNEILNAQDKSRSTRAKLAVLEGKMALALIDAQKITDQKQKIIDNARRALRLLRPISIVWPNLASEVLLAGSFDGWTSKRKMEKSKTGIFSLLLQLYPGRYEIKFIVDGEWRIDPLRPMVNNNGHENNLLIIT